MRAYLLDILKKHPKAIINAFMVLSVGFIFFVTGMGSAHAIDLNDIPSDIRTDMTNYDQACHPPGSGATIYQQSDQWIYYNSESNDGYGTPIALNSGQKITLNIYGIEFLCHPAISSDVPYNGGTTDAADSSVDTAGGSISDPLERAQTIWLTTQVNRAWGTPSVTAINVSTGNSAPAGSISGGVNGSQMETISDNLSTRYWTPSSSASTISYQAPTVTKTTELDVTVNLPTYPANWFDEEGNNTYECEIQPYQSVGSQANFDSSSYLSKNCTVANTPISFVINVSPNTPVCTPTPSCPCGASTCTPPSPPPTTTPPCPNQPSESTAPTITLPQGNQPSVGGIESSGAPSYDTTSPQPNWYEEQPTGEYEINYAGDQYGTTIGWSPTGYNANPFTLNYTNYINDHPYDPHSTNVQYTEEYTQTVYSSQFDYYECPAQWIDYGSQCEFTSEYPAAATCPARWTDEGDGQCEFTAIYSAPESCNSKGKDCVYGPCDAGFFLSGTQCYDYEYIASTPPCGAGYADYGNECIAYWWMNATPVYDWVYAGGPSTVVGQNTEYYGAPQLGECYARTFSLAPTGTSVTVTSTNFSDLPTTVSVRGSVNATFGLDGPEGTPVAACQVNGATTTIAAYYTTPGDPDPQPLPGGSETTNNIEYGTSSGCNGTTSTPVSATFPTSIPPLAYGDTVCAYVSVTPDGDYMDYTDQITDENGTPDPYGNGQTSINPGDAPYSFTDCFSPEAAEPYFKAFGGDVSAGLDSDYISGCYDNSAGIESWNQGGTTSTGAGTTAAALASGGISGFASGQNILSMISPSSLTFANYPSGTGNYGEGGNCGGEDYYALAESIPGAVSCPSTIDSATLAQQGVTFVNPLSQTITVGQNDRYICYSTSSVTIASNITYSPAPANTQPNDLPVFEVIVKGGNIYIDTPFNQAYDVPDPGQPVTQLFGNYVAEISNGQGGTIDDTGPGGNVDVCAYNANGAEDDYNNYCAQDRLVIDGSLTANQVDLYRSYGTLHNASSASTYGSSGGDPNDAEEFDFGPINWLTPGNDKLIIQSITSLPPVL